MKNTARFWFLLSVCLLTLTQSGYSQAKTKIACIGNSITEGWNLPFHRAQSYPSVLQLFLGDKNFEINNYGVSGHAILRKSNAPYWGTSQYKNALEWKPDIVIIKLGTNDTYSYNWVYKDEFVGDYTDFVNSFKALDSHPKIYICYPLPIFPENGTQSKLIPEQVIPMLNQIAMATGAEIIDLYTYFTGKKAQLFGDDLHPNATGARDLAYLVAKAICPEFNAAKESVDLISYIFPFDLGDKSVETISSVSGLDMTSLLDNNPSTVLTTSFQSNMYFEVKLPVTSKITSYSITANEATGSPKSWELHALSGTNWIKINEQQNVTFLSHETKRFEISYASYSTIQNATSYRLVIKDKNGGTNLNIAEWQLFGSPVTFETSITSNGGAVTDQYNSNTGAESVKSLNDNKADTKLCVVEKGHTIWIQYISPTPVQVKRYTLTSANDAPERDPKNWTLEASNNGTDWEVLDTQANQYFASRYCTLEYNVTNGKENSYYTYFRLNVSKILCGKTFQLAEWQLLGKEISKIKVACIGNSITEGIGVSSAADVYPAILQKNLGSKYEVRNFGASGRTMTKEPIAEIGWSYWTHPRYQEALAWEPDIVIIKLGTNDAMPSRWVTFKDHFKEDYTDMVRSFQNLSSEPQVFMCLPLPLSTSSLAQQETNLTTGVIPMIRDVANEMHTTIIDLHTPLLGKGYMTPDGCHPNKRGTTYMAHLVAKALCPECELPALPSDLFLFLGSFDQADKRSGTASSAGGMNLDLLFDNDPETSVNTPFTAESETWFEVELKSNLKMSAYSITSDAAGSSPKTWELQGQSTSGSWIKIDEQKNITFLSAETKVFEAFYTSFSNLRSFKKYRLLIKENNGDNSVSLKEWQIFGNPSTFETSVMSNGGQITDQYNLTGHEGVQYLIDQKADTKYCAVDKGSSYWIHYASTAPIVIDRYTLTSANDAPGRDPVDWTLQGSVLGVRYVELDKQTNQEFVGRFSTLEYPLETGNIYSYFRLNISKLKDGNTFQLAEWQIFAKDETSLQSLNTGGCIISSGNNSIRIKSNQTESVQYFIHTITGQCVAEELIYPGGESIKNCPSGIYLVSLVSASGRSVMKVIV